MTSPSASPSPSPSASPGTAASEDTVVPGSGQPGAQGRILPVANGRQVRANAGKLLASRRRGLTEVVGLYAAATIAGLVPARMLGDIVGAVQQGSTAGHVTVLAGIIALAIGVQAVLTRFGALAGAKLGEGLLAQLREDFVDRVLQLPLSVVEEAGSGDLLSRASRDVAALSRSARYAVPATLTAALTASLTMGAIVLDAPLLALPCLVVVPPVVLITRWYIRRAPAGYLRESAAWAAMTDGLAETVDGARTVQALRLGQARRRRADADIAASYAAERYTLGLRTIFYPGAEASYVLPVAGVLLFGGYGYLHHWCSLEQVTTVALYARALVTPIDELIQWLNALQVGGASLARLLGLAAVPADRVAGGSRPAGDVLVASDVSHAYVPGHDVLRRLSLDVGPGERLAIVGPSGAGKSTLGRLLAGIMAPGAGSVAVGGVPLTELPLGELRGQIALVTQEHHIFMGTLAENVTLGVPGAGEDAVRRALAAVDALPWALGLPDGLQTIVGSGGLALSPPQAQQVALARLVLADPHTLILDEATSLLDPRSARRLERSLSAVLDGRTVVAIAHRLHTAHDADRVIVMEAGLITEAGSHSDLVGAAGPYAALWDSWHGTGGTGGTGGGTAAKAGEMSRGESSALVPAPTEMARDGQETSPVVDDSVDSTGTAALHSG